MQGTASSIKNLPNSWDKSNISLLQTFVPNPNSDSRRKKQQLFHCFQYSLLENTLLKNAYCDFPGTFAIWRVHSRKTFAANKARLSSKNAATCENRSGKIKEEKKFETLSNNLMSISERCSLLIWIKWILTINCLHHIRDLKYLLALRINSSLIKHSVQLPSVSTMITRSIYPSIHPYAMKSST